MGEAIPTRARAMYSHTKSFRQLAVYSELVSLSSQHSVGTGAPTLPWSRSGDGIDRGGSRIRC
jgi:hypothetical protein